MIGRLVAPQEKNYPTFKLCEVRRCDFGPGAAVYGGPFYLLWVAFDSIFFKPAWGSEAPQLSAVCPQNNNGKLSYSLQNATVKESYEVSFENNRPISLTKVSTKDGVSKKVETHDVTSDWKLRTKPEMADTKLASFIENLQKISEACEVNPDAFNVVNNIGQRKVPSSGPSKSAPVKQ